MRLKFLFAWVFLAENHGLRAWWATQSMGSKRVRHNWETKHISTQTHMSCEILVPQPGIKPESPVMEAQSLNHWTAREARRLKCFKFLFCLCDILLDFSDGSDGEESSCNARDPGLIPGLGRSPGEGNGYPLQDSCLENPMDRGAWWATMGLQRVQHNWATNTHSLVCMI